MTLPGAVHGQPTSYRVIIKHALGSCLAIYDGNNDSKPYGWACNRNDARQIWWYYPSLGLIQSQQGSCLAIYDGKNDSKPYGWSCNAGDKRQQWKWYKSGHIQTALGSCLSLYDGNNDSKAYGWRCLTDQRQNWALITV